MHNICHATQTMCGAYVAPKHLYNDACVVVDIIESC